MSQTQAEAQEGSDTLLMITEFAHHIAADFPFAEALSSLPGIGPDTVSVILKTISKLGYYYTIPQELLQATRKYTIFKAITVEVTKYAADTKTIKTTEDSQSNGVVARIQRVVDNKTALLNNGAPGTRELLAQIKQYRTLQSQLRCLDCSKYPVHAEIQLLAYYELHRSKLPPRVILSSKKACFLCNLFFGYHGKFFIANSHGRAYEKWALPQVFHELDTAQAYHIISVVCKFETEVTRIADVALQSGRTRLYQYPNESIVLESVVWSIISRLSKRRDRDMSERELLPNAAENHSKQEDITLPSKNADKNSISSSKRTASSSQNQHSVKIIAPATDSRTSCNMTPPASSSKSLSAPHHRNRSNDHRNFTELRRGDPVNTTLSPLGPSFYAGTSNINLLLSSASPETSKLRYSIGIKLLPLDEQKDDPLPLIVDIDRMREGEEVVVEGNSLIFRRHEDAISIEYVLQNQDAAL
ncbi:hypothetical protein MMC26_000504 [Xylographa opegraphella]|nr:hypothetical protein [Xylographa opegraphella]